MRKFSTTTIHLLLCLLATSLLAVTQQTTALAQTTYNTLIVTNPYDGTAHPVDVTLIRNITFTTWNGGGDISIVNDENRGIIEEYDLDEAIITFGNTDGYTGSVAYLNLYGTQKCGSIPLVSLAQITFSSTLSGNTKVYYMNLVLKNGQTTSIAVSDITRLTLTGGMSFTTIPKTANKAYVKYTTTAGDEHTVEMAKYYGEEGSYHALAFIPAEVALSTMQYSFNNTTWSPAFSSGSSAAQSSVGEGWSRLLLRFQPDGYLRSADPLSVSVERSSEAKTGYAFVCGDVAGGDWTTENSAWKLSMPVNADGWWASPRFQGDGEVRAYSSAFPDRGAEFTILDGKVYWSESSIISWMADMGSEYSVQGKAGQKLYVNFTTGEALVSTPDEVPFPLENPVFKTGNTTAESEVCKVITNAVELRWTPVDGASGYEIVYGLSSKLQAGGDVWDNPDNIIGRVTVDGEQTQYTVIPHLDFATSYHFAIRALSPRGEQYHSAWFGRGSSRRWYAYCALTTEERHDVPTVITVSDVTKTSMRVHLNRSIATGYTNAQLTTFRTYFNFIDNDKTTLRVDYLTVEASQNNPDAYVPEQYQHFTLTDADFERGYIDIDGLSENSVYVLTTVDSSIKFVTEGCYNIVTKRTKGTPEAPVLIHHVPNNTMTVYEQSYDISLYNSMELDGLLKDYMEGNKPENQVFYLEGGKAYHISSSVELYKGFTLQTNPDDMAEGKRAKLYLNGLAQQGMNTITAQFMLGRNALTGESSATQLEIDQIRFLDLDIDCPLAINYGSAQEIFTGATGNYFINMYSGGLGFDLNLIEWNNCTVQHIQRGFFRMQGSSVKNIHNIKMIDCEFYNCGYYTYNGNGYGWLYADYFNNTNSNLLENVEISGCIFNNSPVGALVTTGTRSATFDENVRWHVNIHHNTFVNFQTQSSSSPFVQLYSIPCGSLMEFHDNVIIVTKDAADTNRAMNAGGWRTNYIQGGDGSGSCTFNVFNNWTTDDREVWGRENLFSSYDFASTGSRYLGSFLKTCNFPAGIDELAVHVSALKSTDLMLMPNPVYFVGDIPSSTDFYGDRKSMLGLNYQCTARVHKSDIYKSGAGCPKLRVLKYMIGDANDDGIIDAADVTAMTDYILGRTSGTFVPAAADLNYDDKIDVSDIVAEIALILSNPN